MRPVTRTRAAENGEPADPRMRTTVRFVTSEVGAQDPTVPAAEQAWLSV
jgi:hypothetical protein